jgi:hypothetical protein
MFAYRKQRGSELCGSESTVSEHAGDESFRESLVLERLPSFSATSKARAEPKAVESATDYKSHYTEDYFCESIEADHSGTDGESIEAHHSH